MELTGVSSYKVSDIEQRVAHKIKQKVVESGGKVGKEALLELQKDLEYTTYKEACKEVKTKESIKSTFHFTEEEMCFLYTQGIDIEHIDLEELEYRSHGIKRVYKKPDKEVELEEKIEVIKQNKENMYAHSIEQEGPVTINALYENCFKGEFKATKSSYKEEDVRQVLKLNGMKENETNLKGAQFLMMHEMDISPTKINRLAQIQAAVESLNSGSGSIYSGDSLLVKDNEVQYEESYIGRITDDLGMVTDEYIKELIDEGKTIDIKSLREITHYNQSRKQSSEYRAINIENVEGELLQAKPYEEGAYEEILYEKEHMVNEVKTQINQIRAKLTVEAAQKISAYIPLETSPLSEVVETLLEVSKTGAEKAIAKVIEGIDLEVKEDAAVKCLQEVLWVKQKIHVHYPEVIGLQLGKEEQMSLYQIDERLKEYQKNETEVDVRFGETTKRVQGQIGELLTSLGIEVTELNKEAAKALIANNMEVTYENIVEVHPIMIKMNTFLEEVTPMEVARLIKEGINPYYCSVDRILNEIAPSKIKALKNNVAEAIMALQKEGAIDETYKNGMIGLYKIIDRVQKQKEEVVGYIYKNGLKLTLENLQVATKYIKGKGIEKEIDDGYEAAKGINTSKEWLEVSKEEAETIKSILKEIETIDFPIHEQKKISRLGAFLYPFIKESFKKQLGSFEGTRMLPESFIEKLDEVQQMDEKIIQHMTESKIPLTLSNLYWMNEFYQHTEHYNSLLQGEPLFKQVLPNSLKEFEERIEGWEKEAERKKEEAVIKEDEEDYEHYKKIEEIVKFQKQRIDSEGLYHIPFILEGEARTLSVYVYDHKSRGKLQGEVKLKMTYKTEQLGEVVTYIHMNQKKIGYKIEMPQMKSEQMLEQSKVLNTMLEKLGYEVVGSKFEYHQERIEEQEKETEEMLENQKVESASLFETLV